MRNFSVIAVLVLLISWVEAGKKRLTMDEWLKQKHDQLAEVEDPTKIRAVDLGESMRKNQDGLYHLFPKKGYLKFPDGSWVLLTSHSAHAEDGLGDISLIRTSTGEFYSNRGHCCLPIGLYSAKKVESLEDFLKTHGKGGNGKLTLWEKYLGEADGG